MRGVSLPGAVLLAAAGAVGAGSWLDEPSYGGPRYRPKRKNPPQHPTNKRAKVKAARKAAKRNRT